MGVFECHARCRSRLDPVARLMQRFRTKALLDRAVRGIAPIESSPDDALPPFTPPGPPPHAAALVRISCTAPLKHQLSGAAMHLLGSSRTLGIVNTLGLVGDTWWGADTDGPGVVWVARHHGIDPSKGATLAVTGGGSTARSAAFAWIEAGGSVIPRLGRRELDLPLDVLEGVLEGGSPDVMLITEGDAMHPPGEDGHWCSTQDTDARRFLRTRSMGVGSLLRNISWHGLGSGHQCVFQSSRPSVDCMRASSRRRP